MKVVKRDGSIQEAKLDKLTQRLKNLDSGLDVDPFVVAKKAADGLYDKITTREIDNILIQISSLMTAIEPDYSKLAGRILSSVINKEVEQQEIHTFYDYVKVAHEHGLLSQETMNKSTKWKSKLNIMPRHQRDELFNYFGLQTVYDRYLLKNPKTRLVIEKPQFMFLRVAIGGSDTIEQVKETYDMISNHLAMFSTPTLFNSGTNRSQMSSCYLLDAPEDDLKQIFRQYDQVAQLSKWAGGIGLSYSKVRSRNSLIKGTNGKSNGIIPWIKILDSTVAAVNQCFSPNTLIYTNNGAKKIKSINVGSLVLTNDGSYRKVTEVMIYDQKDKMVEITTVSSVNPIVVTDAHPILAIKNAKNANTQKKVFEKIKSGKLNPEWVDSGMLNNSDMIGIPIPVEFNNNDLSSDDCYFYGLMISAGYIHSTKNEADITLEPGTDAQKRFLTSYLEKLDIPYVTSEGEEFYSIKFPSDKLKVSIDDVYSDDGGRFISTKYLHLNPILTKSILKGVFGSVEWYSKKNRIQLNTTSGRLVHGLRYLALKLGVLASVSKKESKSRSGVIKITGESYSFDSATKYCIKIPAVKQIAEIFDIKATEKKNWIINRGIIYCSVKSVKEVKPTEKVYDLKVDGNECYATVDFLAHNGGKRKGSACVYLETWHQDILEFLELRDNTGDNERRAHNLNLANWVPDLFMKRVETDEDWSMFDPNECKNLSDLYGPEFEKAYLEYEQNGLAKSKIKARELYSRMMKTLAQTGNGWMNFKDSFNLKSNQTLLPENVIHSSNLCTEIGEVTNKNEVAVCNLGSINLSMCVQNGEFNYSVLKKNTRIMVRFLNRVIDKNFYPIEESKTSNNKWRPIGLGIMGLQDVFFKLGIPFESQMAITLSTNIQKTIYFEAVRESVDIAKEDGAFPAFKSSKASKGILQPELWGVEGSLGDEYAELCELVKKNGMANSLLIAIAPTATIASIVGCYECIEPQVSNAFKRETLSGEFLQVNTYLVKELKALNLWTDEVRDLIKINDGSIQEIAQIPQNIKDLFKTAWEVSMKTLINLAAERAPFIDQSQSLNLFVMSPTIGKLSSMYMYAWKRGLKSTYYLKSRPATKINKATVQVSDESAIACSLENPEACESCQ